MYVCVRSVRVHTVHVHVHVLYMYMYTVLLYMYSILRVQYMYMYAYYQRVFFGTMLAHVRYMYMYRTITCTAHVLYPWLYTVPVGSSQGDDLRAHHECGLLLRNSK